MSNPTDTPTHDSQVVLLDWPAPLVARLRINRPDKRNAMDRAVREQIGQALDALEALPQERRARALVFGGVGGVFSAGGDLPSMVGLDEAGARERMSHVAALCRRVAALPVPMVSGVEGFAAGAAVGLALLGDRIIVGVGTRFLFPFLRLGLAPDWGQVLTLPRRVGLGAARRIFTSDAPVPGAEALRIGLADALVPDAEVAAEAVRQAQALAALPQQAFSRMKARLNSPSASLEEELAREVADQVVCMQSDDFREGYDAFANKRRPDFVNRMGRTDPTGRSEGNAA